MHTPLQSVVSRMQRTMLKNNGSNEQVGAYHRRGAWEYCSLVSVPSREILNILPKQEVAENCHASVDGEQDDEEVQQILAGSDDRLRHDGLVQAVHAHIRVADTRHLAAK